ncbi:MAG: hypothetical protein PHV74_12785 [Dehalococcoidia bacterium]|nr:hypothetical protein [Dehalococcoidia bacterium]
MIRNHEKETIIIFNESEYLAQIFTYNKAWQRHFRDRLGIEPVEDNGAGGKTYEISKSRIRPPHALRQLREETRQKLAERLRRNRRDSL